jgi:hypothetical protein
MMRQCCAFVIGCIARAVSRIELVSPSIKPAARTHKYLGNCWRSGTGAVEPSWKTDVVVIRLPHIANHRQNARRMV